MTQAEAAQAKQLFVNAAVEWCRLRDEISAFRQPTKYVTEFCDLTAAHGQAEKRMRAAYKAWIEVQVRACEMYEAGTERTRGEK